MSAEFSDPFAVGLKLEQAVNNLFPLPKNLPKNKRDEMLKARAYFVDAATHLLGIVESESSNPTDFLKGRVINLLCLAGLACRVYDGDAKTIPATIKRTLDSRLIDELVQHHAARTVKNNRKIRHSALAIAQNIHDRLNEDLKPHNLKLGVRAIRRRIKLA
jgi:hypothetical protein